jgi:glycosyltransferase involved in cell wall biosynthesis
LPAVTSFQRVLEAAPPVARKRVAICMPAYFASKTLEATLRAIPAGCYDLLILGDDASTDGTAELAATLGCHVIRSASNRGYGGNQKQIYQAALDQGAEIVVMLHPDGQYDARLIPYFVGFVAAGVADLMLGNRVRTRRECLRDGMPVWKYLSNRLLTIFENVMLGQNLGEFHSGFRVYRREVLETIPFHGNSEDFVFDSEVIAQAVWFGFKVADAPMPVRYFPEASSIGMRRSLRYGISTVSVVLRFLLARTGIYRSRLFTRTVSEPRGSSSST